MDRVIKELSHYRFLEMALETHSPSILKKSAYWQL